jgi:hypothetical protein
MGMLDEILGTFVSSPSLLQRRAVEERRKLTRQFSQLIGTVITIFLVSLSRSSTARVTTS